MMIFQLPPIASPFPAAGAGRAAPAPLPSASVRRQNERGKSPFRFGHGVRPSRPQLAVHSPPAPSTLATGRLPMQQ